jgi:hypothetical protein
MAIAPMLRLLMPQTASGFSQENAHMARQDQA